MLLDVRVRKSLFSATENIIQKCTANHGSAVVFWSGISDPTDIAGGFKIVRSCSLDIRCWRSNLELLKLEGNYTMSKGQVALSSAIVSRGKSTPPILESPGYENFNYHISLLLLPWIILWVYPNLFIIYVQKRAKIPANCKGKAPLETSVSPHLLTTNSFPISSFAIVEIKHAHISIMNPDTEDDNPSAPKKPKSVSVSLTKKDPMAVKRGNKPANQRGASVSAEFEQKTEKWNVLYIAKLSGSAQYSRKGTSSPHGSARQKLEEDQYPIRFSQCTAKLVQDQAASHLTTHLLHVWMSWSWPGYLPP